MISCAVIMMDQVYTSAHSLVNAHSYDSGVHSFGMGLSDNIRALVDVEMQKHGISMNALAKLMGLNQPTLLRICDGTTQKPTIDNLSKIASYFSTTIEALRRGTVTEFTELSRSDSVQGGSGGAESYVDGAQHETSIEVVTAAVSALLGKFGMTLDDYVLAKRAAERGGRRTVQPTFKRLSDRSAAKHAKVKKSING